jgi:hypothetical protein
MSWLAATAAWRRPLVHGRDSVIGRMWPRANDKMVFHASRDWNTDMDDDEHDRVAFHVDPGTKLSHFP